MPSSTVAHDPASSARHPRVVVVTGGAGFIGSHVCEALLARGTRVVVLDNFDPYYDPAAKRANIAEVAASPHAKAAGFELVEGDICDGALVRATFERVRPESVIHLAAKAGVRPSIADPAGYSRVNVLGTSVLLEESRRVQASRFVMASSSSVYGNAPVAPFHEELDVSEPISPYAATKRACELIGYTHWTLTRMPTACLRFFTVYGPRQRPDLAITLFMRRIARGEPIELFGAGSTSRDYTFVGDIVAGVLAAHDRIDAHGYRVWNLGNSAPVTLSDMVQAIARTVGRPANTVSRPAQPGDVERTFADLTRARRELGFDPKTPFDDGLARHWAWLRPRV